jgi:hypothetical protein
MFTSRPGTGQKARLKLDSRLRLEQYHQHSYPRPRIVASSESKRSAELFSTKIGGAWFAISPAAPSSTCASKPSASTFSRSSRPRPASSASSSRRATATVSSATGPG